MIKVLIVDDNTVVRKGLIKLIAREVDIEVVGDAPDGLTALDILNKYQDIDIVLLDYNMPDMDGVGLTARIASTSHPAKVIILTMHRQTTFRDRAFVAGAKGYLLKGEDEEELFAGIRAVYAGQAFISPTLSI